MTELTYILALTHDEIIALAHSLDLLRETLLVLGNGSISLPRDLTTIKNIDAIAEKLPDEQWFEEAVRNDHS